MNSNQNIFPRIIKNWLLSILLGSGLSSIYVAFSENWHFSGDLSYFYQEILYMQLLGFAICATLSFMGSIPVMIVTAFSGLGIRMLKLPVHQVKFLMALLISLLTGVAVSYTLTGNEYMFAGIGIYSFSGIAFFVNDRQLMSALSHTP